LSALNVMMSGRIVKMMKNVTTFGMTKIFIMIVPTKLMKIFLMKI
jgi:hypothetical protein